MSKETFGWWPDAASEASEEPRVNVTKYGDGYESRTSDTINTNPGTWTLTFTKGRAEGLEIRAFLRARGALEAFIWTNPFGETGTYVCRKWKFVPDRGKLTGSATFEQVYEQ